ncbi:protein PIN-LIKES 3-like isoform X1 [Daucus carota subsp. sativus]|nr:PREDICTED: protein PIN-LIKES 3-like isoform X1 [Daucus carota subsp. sativus]
MSSQVVGVIGLMRLFSLFVAASVPVVKVLLLTALGSLLALDHINVLSPDARKHLNTIVFYVFSPALITSNLAKTITYESIIKLWFMPLNILISFVVGSLLGWVVNLLTRPPPHLRGLVVGCCAAGNLGAIPIIIVPAVCKEKGSPFGDRYACNSYGLTYVSLSMAIGAIYLWVYVYNVLRLSIQAIPEELSVSSIGKCTMEPNIAEQGSLIEARHSPIRFVRSEDHADALPSTRFDEEPELGFTYKIKQHAMELSGKLNLKKLFAPSTNGAIVGFIVGLIPPLRKSMIGDSAPFHVIEDTIILLGDGAIPLLTLIIGANLLKGLRSSGTPKFMVFGIIVARYIVLPSVGIGVVKAAVHLNLVQADPLYQFVLLLQFALPPAMNIGTMMQLFGKGESECSVIMLCCYVCALVSLSLWCTFFMWLVG